MAHSPSPFSSPSASRPYTYGDLGHIPFVDPGSSVGAVASRAAAPQRSEERRSAEQRLPASVPASAPAPAPVRIPTVFTDNSTNKMAESARDTAIQVVDSEGEIQFFDRDSHRPVFDLDAERMLSWLLFRHAQDVLSFGDKALELRAKTTPALYSVLPSGYFSTSPFVGPILVRSKKHATVDATGVPLERLQPIHRVVTCMTRRVPRTAAEIWQHVETLDCNWHNVIVCGSPWECPLCSRRINKARQEQIKAVYEAFECAGVVGGAYMLTFTVKHGLGDACADTVSKMKDAMQLFFKSFAYKNVTRKVPLKRPQANSLPLPHLGYVGRIAALEVTHGSTNGWHPHEHHLWFFERTLSPSDVSTLKQVLFDAWHDACVAVGLGAPSRKFGLDIRRALSAADYLTKFGTERRWGPEKEIASSHSKKGSATVGKGRTPMQILLDSFTKNAESGEDKFIFNADAGLFRDYAKAFKGRHQLQFSDSLRKWMDLHSVAAVDSSEAGDVALASALVDADSVLALTVSDADFASVVHHRMQHEVLRICKDEGFAAAAAFMAALPARPSFKPIDPSTVVCVRTVIAGVPLPESTPVSERGTCADGSHEYVYVEGDENWFPPR